MGGPKTQLLKRDRYGLLKAAELAAEMLADYERATDGGREMRVEETTEPVWDDAVVYRNNRTDKWQIKRQTTAFELADARSLVTASIPWSPPPPSMAPTEHHFGFAELVPVGQGKEPKFDCVELRELCDASRVPQLDITGFADAYKEKGAFKFIVDTLGSTVSATTIVVALQHLHVHRLGTEDELRRKAASHLSEFFTNVDHVVEQLHAWFVQHSDGLIQIDSHLLHELVIEKHAKWQPSKGRWVHFSRRDTTNWETRGPLPVEKVVDGAWGSAENVRIDIGSKPYAGDSMRSSLTRLLLHRTRSAHIGAADATRVGIRGE